MAARETDVLIVGLGPVGAALAGLLAQWGVRAIAVDREREIYKQPRAAHFDHEIMRVFQQLGIAEAVLPYTRAISAYEFRNAAGDLLIDIQQRDTETPSSWRASYMFHQPGLEEALRAKLAQRSEITTLLGTSLTALEENNEGGIVARVAHDDGSEERIAARFLVGCDGGGSTVRRLTDIELFDFGFDEPWLVIDALVEDESMLPQCGLQHCDPRRPTTVMPMSKGRRRWEFMLRPDETAEQMLDDTVVAALLAPWMNPAGARVVRKAVYRFHGLVAKQWRAGSVLLAGDAAHQMPPFMGQGMCSGIRDAASLAWRLGMILKHGAAPTLLDSYQSERDPHVRAIVGMAIAMGRVVCTMDEAAAAARDAGMLAARRARGGASDPQPALPPPGDGLFLHAPRARELFPQTRTASGERFDDVGGQGFWLVTRDARPRDVPPFVRHHVLGDDLQAWLGGEEAVLVRPDRYVFGTGTPGALLAALSERLSD